MGFLDTINEKWAALAEKTAPARQKMGAFFKKTGDVMGRIWRYMLRLKKVFLAIPIVVGAVVLALRNMDVLPENVGLGLQTDGTYSMMFPQILAVLLPLAVTALCLLLMFISKRTLTPWLVSAISLVLPLVIWLINAFPA